MLDWKCNFYKSSNVCTGQKKGSEKFQVDMKGIYINFLFSIDTGYHNWHKTPAYHFVQVCRNTIVENTCLRRWKVKLKYLFALRSTRCWPRCSSVVNAAAAEDGEWASSFDGVVCTAGLDGEVVTVETAVDVSSFETTTYGWCLVVFLPLRLPCSDSTGGMTIFNGGTFGPGLPTFRMPSSPSSPSTEVVDFGLELLAEQGLAITIECKPWIIVQWSIK